MLSHRNGHKFSGPLMIIFLMDVGSFFKAFDFELLKHDEKYNIDMDFGL